MVTLVAIVDMEFMVVVIMWGWGRRDGHPTDHGGDEEKAIGDV